MKPPPVAKRNTPTIVKNMKHNHRHMKKTGIFFLGVPHRHNGEELLEICRGEGVATSRKKKEGKGERERGRE